MYFFTFEVVASLERVETQYALMGQKLSEAVEAMGRIQTKVEEMKKDLEITTREKMELESRKAELISELEVELTVSSECVNTFHLGTFKVCSMRLENLGEVNSSCKEKLGELEVCKSEIGRLADVVEKRFSQVGDSESFFLKFIILIQVKEEKEEEQQLRSRAVLLEESMQEVNT